MTQSLPKPVAEGSFAQTPFGNILVYINGRVMSGTLDIVNGDTRLKLFFSNGNPVAFKCPAMKDASLRQCLLDAFAMIGGRYAFYANINLVGAPMDTDPPLPKEILITAARMHSNVMGVNHVVGSLKGLWFFLKPDAPLDRFHFTEDEMKVCRELIGHPIDLLTLRDWAVVDNDTKKNVLFVLLLTKVLQTTDNRELANQTLGQVSIAPPPPKKKEDAQPAVAVAYTPVIQKKRDKVKAKITVIKTQNYYEMLDVPVDADPNEIKRAFLKTARDFHPDLASRKGMEDLKDDLVSLFAQLSEAQATLIDSTAREEYNLSLNNHLTQQQTEEEQEIVRTFAADNAYQKALVMLKRKQLAEAFEFASTAVENSSDAEYAALHQYLLVTFKEQDPSTHLEDLRAAAKEFPKSERINLFFAHILKACDKKAEARQQFQRVVEINQHNIDAAREIRLLDMASRKSGKHTKPSLFNRFKK